MQRAGSDWKDTTGLNALRQVEVHARDDASPEWEAVGRPTAGLIDSFELKPSALGNRRRADAEPGWNRPRHWGLRGLSAGLLRRNGFIPAYAAFNLIWS